MTTILGISAYYHDSAACLLRDGQVVAAVSEERLTRRKHDAAFPVHAVQACLKQAHLTNGEIDYVGFYEKPLLKFDRLLETYLAFAPRGFRSFAAAMPGWLRTKLHLPREIRRHLQDAYRRRVIFCEHHESHAASAFYPSPFDQAAILTLDGVGEWATTCWGIGQGNRISLKQEIRFPHSLGLLYSAFTYFCGFRVNSGEYKLMGLAPFGEPHYQNVIMQKLIEIREDGSFRMNMDYFNYCHGLTMTNGRFNRLFGATPRQPDSPIRQLDRDLAASIQKVTEEIILRIANYVHRRTHETNLCLAGGVALNCVANGRLLREGPFERIWIQPAAGDSGGALGVALLIWHQLLAKTREPNDQDSLRGSLLGPTNDPSSAIVSLRAAGAVFREQSDEKLLLSEVAKLLADGRVVGWLQGPMEFGPRALGARSILGDPRNPQMQSVINLKVKRRESFRPFAPAVLRDQAAEYFEIPAKLDSPYMLFTFPVAKPHRNEVQTPAPQDLLQRVNQIRSSLPAITHLDYSARIQTVDPVRHGLFFSAVDRVPFANGLPRADQYELQRSRRTDSRDSRRCLPMFSCH